MDKLTYKMVIKMINKTKNKNNNNNYCLIMGEFLFNNNSKNRSNISRMFKIVNQISLKIIKRKIIKIA